MVDLVEPTQLRLVTQRKEEVRKVLSIAAHDCSLQCLHCVIRQDNVRVELGSSGEPCEMVREVPDLRLQLYVRLV